MRKINAHIKYHKFRNELSAACELKIKQGRRPTTVLRGTCSSLLLEGLSERRRKRHNLSSRELVSSARRSQYPIKCVSPTRRKAIAHCLLPINEWRHRSVTNCGAVSVQRKIWPQHSKHRSSALSGTARTWTYELYYYIQFFEFFNVYKYVVKSCLVDKMYCLILIILWDFNWNFATNE